MHPADVFLAALGKHRVTFQTFPDSDQATGGPRILHGPHPKLARQLAKLNQSGHGIFVMVNHGDLQGRRAQNVQGVAAYFVDLDGTPLFDLWPAPPTLVVESSPGRYHAYWRIKNGDPDVFPHTQQHLATLLDGDPAVHDLPRVMRLPGYAHTKREPFTTRILHQADVEYTHQEFADVIALPKKPVPLPEACRAYKRMHEKRRRQARGEPARDPLETACERITSAREGTRNDTLFRTAAAVANDVAKGKVDRSKAEDALTSAARDAGLPDWEAGRTIRSALRYAT